MTKEEIAQKLVDIYTNPDIITTAASGVFAFMYGNEAVDVYTPTELINLAHQLNAEVKTRYGAELNAAFAMYRHFKQHPELFNVAKNGLSVHTPHFPDINVLPHQKITYGAPGTGKATA